MQSVRRSVDLHGLIVTVDGTYVSAAVAEDGTFALFDVPARDVVLDFSAPNMSVSIPIGALERRDLVQVGVTLGDGTVTLDHLAFMSPNAAR
jgi:hypothetical protein